MRKDLTYEGLRADLGEAITQQECMVREWREKMELEVRRTGGACYGEPAFRHEGEDLERASEHLDILYGYAEDLAEGSLERRSIRPGDPREGPFVEELLEVLDR